MTDSSQDSSGNPSFSSLDLDEVANVDLKALHAQVLTRNGRVELSRGGESCILVSKRELESLEAALEVLSDTEAVRAMRDEIAHVARIATPRTPISPSLRSRIRLMNLP